MEQKKEETVIPLHYKAGMSEYFRMHDYRNLYQLWEHFCITFERKTEMSVKWYSKDEIYHFLKTKSYSDVIAEELSTLWSDSLQGAFSKGHEKSEREFQQQILDKDKENERLREALHEIRGHTYAFGIRITLICFLVF